MEPKISDNPPVTRSWSWKHKKLVSDPNTIGDSVTMEDLRSMVKKALAANEAQITEIERCLGSQLQELSSPFKEMLAGIGQNMQAVSEGTVSSHNPRKQPSQVFHAGSRSQGTNHHPGNVVVPWYTKLEFLIFNGYEDPLIWLHRCEKFLSINTHQKEIRWD